MGQRQVKARLMAQSQRHAALRWPASLLQACSRRQLQGAGLSQEPKVEFLHASMLDIADSAAGLAVNLGVSASEGSPIAGLPEDDDTDKVQTGARAGVGRFDQGVGLDLELPAKRHADGDRWPEPNIAGPRHGRGGGRKKRRQEARRATRPSTHPGLRRHGRP